MADEGQLLRIDLSGLDPATFDRLFGKLAQALESSVARVTGDRPSPGTRQAIDDLATIAKNFAQARLQRPTLENQKLLAEIAEAFSAAEVNAQQARKTAAEADKQELENVLTRVQVILQLLSATQRLRALPTADGQTFVLDVSTPAIVPRVAQPEGQLPPATDTRGSSA
jgi:hypothetical protein